MRPEPAPVAARPLAQHSAKLLAANTAGNHQSVALVLAAERIARELSLRLARLVGECPAVACAPPSSATTAELAAVAGALAANSLFAGGPRGTRFLASVEAAAVFRLIDRAFGGQGDLPEPMPGAFPLSSELLIERVESVIASALSAALDLPAEQPLLALRRDANLAQVTPFAPGEPLTLLSFDVAEAGGDSWRLTLAFADATINALFAGNGEPPSLPGAGPAAADPRGTPFGDVPLPLTAVLVDMQLPLSRLARLKVGEVLPVAVARSVPLCLDGKTLAHGNVGALDDRVALQLVSAFP